MRRGWPRGGSFVSCWPVGAWARGRGAVLPGLPESANPDGQTPRRPRPRGAYRRPGAATGDAEDATSDVRLRSGAHRKRLRALPHWDRRAVVIGDFHL